jgi:phytoene dehydrogenase-like protein
MAVHPPTVVVVGAGLAGLTAASTAAEAGAHVTVLEAREHAGGRARTITVDGFHLNQGAHALYRGGPAWATLAELGITPRGTTPDASHALGLRADGTLGALPTSATSILRSQLVGWRTKLELARVLSRPAGLTRTVRDGQSMQTWIDSRTHDADARALLAMLGRVTTYCGELDALDARAGVAQLRQAIQHGVVYLDGGWQQLVDELQEAARARGVELRAGAKADMIETRGDAFVVRTAHGDVHADAVVHAAGGPKDVATLLHGASAVVDDWAARERPVYASTLDVALRALPEADERVVFGLDEPLYFSVHTPAARLVDGPGEVAHLIWNGEHDGADGSTDQGPRARLEALLDRVQPGWRDQVVDARFGRRLEVTHGRPLPGSGFAGRPPVTVPDVPGLFVAGDWVGDRGLLSDAAFASGRAAGSAAGRAAARVVGAGVRMSA